MSTAIRQAAREAIRLCRQRISLAREHRLRGAAGASGRLPPSLLQHLAREDWAGLAEAAREAIAKHMTAIKAAGERERLAVLADEKWRSFQALAAASGLARPRAEPRRKKSAAGGQPRLKSAAAAAKADEAVLAKRLEAESAERSEAMVRGLLGGCLALAVARFNMAVARQSPQPPEPAAKCFSRTEAQLSSSEQAVWSALRAGGIAAAADAGRGLSAFAAAALFGSVIAHAAHLARVRSQSARPAAAIDRLALQAGDLIRSLLRAIALGQHVARLAGLPAGSRLASEWLAAARKLPFHGKLKLPPLKKIADLAKNPRAMNGKACCIEGRLEALTIKHRGGKAISTAIVADAAGKAVTIAIPYIKLDSGGMSPGSSVRIAGVWRSFSKEAGGPALEIDRINHGELAEKSWAGFAAHSLRGVFMPVAHGLACGWSWQPGRGGPGNPLLFHVWHGRARRASGRPSAAASRKAMRINPNPQPPPQPAIDCAEVWRLLLVAETRLVLVEALIEAIDALAFITAQAAKALDSLYQGCLASPNPSNCQELDDFADKAWDYFWNDLAEQWALAMTDREELRDLISVLEKASDWCHAEMGDFPCPIDELGEFDPADLDEIEGGIADLESDVADAEAEIDGLLAEAENLPDDGGDAGEGDADLFA